LRDPVFSRFGTVPACDRQTDKRTQEDSTYRASIASALRGKTYQSQSIKGSWAGTVITAFS